MIIDSHTHVQRTDNFWDSPPERIIRLMDSAGIDMSIIMPYSDDPELVEYMARSVERFPERLMAYARLNPAGGEEAINLLEKAVKTMGIKGLKLHPVGNLVHPAHESSENLIRKAGELGVPTLFHCGDEEFTLPLQISAVAEKCPDSIIILGHMGGYFHVNDAIKSAEIHTNIYLETSAMPYPSAIKTAVEKIGPERVLFASDGPGCPPDLELKKIRLANLSRVDEEKILSTNIRRILRMA